MPSQTQPFKERLLLPPNATKLERDLAQVMGSPYELAVYLREQLDPMLCEPDMLPLLAWSWSIDFWVEDWPEIKKRTVVANAARLHRIKGTEEGLRAYIELAGATLISVRTPPEKLFLAADPTKEERDAFMALMPELRLYRDPRKGETDMGVYLGYSFLDGDDVPGEGLTEDQGEFLYGRQGKLFRHGVEVGVSVTRIDERTERVSVRGMSGPALFLNDGFVGDGLDLVQAEAKLLTVNLNRGYLHETSDLWLNMLSPGLTPVSPRYERISITGVDPNSLYDGLFLESEFMTPDDGGRLMYDRLRLIDTNEVRQYHGDADFLDDARIGIEAFTAEVMVKVDRFAPSLETYAEDDFLDVGYLVDDDLTIQSQVLDAICVSKAHRDKVLVTFETTRPIEFGDELDLGSDKTFNERVRRYL